MIVIIGVDRYSLGWCYKTIEFINMGFNVYGFTGVSDIYTEHKDYRGGFKNFHGGIYTPAPSFTKILTIWLLVFYGIYNCR